MDLLEENERKRLTTFAKSFFEDIKLNSTTRKRYPPLVQQEFKYEPSQFTEKIDNQNKKCCYYNRFEDMESNLSLMVERFSGTFLRRYKSL